MFRRHLLLVIAALLVLLPALFACAPAPATSASVVSPSDREKYATEATWAPGQLQAHFQKHPEGYKTVEEYDRGARDTIRRGVAFTYVDRETNERRLGFYDRDTSRFTALTQDGRRITTHFRPDQREQYVRRLPGSTYR